MATNRFLTLVNGVKTLVSAISSFTGNANEIVATDGSGFIDASLLPPGVGGCSFENGTADGNLTAGMLVDVYDNLGTLTVRPADNTNGEAADGFVTTAYTSGATNVMVFTSGDVTGAGLTAGEDYWLSTAGTFVLGPPAEPENGISQKVGVAKTATELCFLPSDPCAIDLIP